MKLSMLVGKLFMVSFVLLCQTGLSQTSPAPAAVVAAGPASVASAAGRNPSNEEVVKVWYTAFEKKDWNSMAQILADGFTFSSPLDDHISTTRFKERCWPNAYNIKRIELDKIIVSGDEVFVISNGWTNDGKLFRNGDYFKLKDGKIATYECFFGPGVNYPNSGK